MSKEKKKNFWYWLGNFAVGALSIGITFSDQIFGQFPAHTFVKQWGWLISPILKFGYDSWKYQSGTIAPAGKRLLDAGPNWLTGEYNINPYQKKIDAMKNRLPGGLRKKPNQ